MQGDDDATIWVNPSTNGNVGGHVLPFGDNMVTLFALGPTNPPIPTRCCAICNGEDYEGISHILSHDVLQTNISSCAAFSLHFWDENSLQSWYCVFHDTTASTPQNPLDPTQPVYHYLPMV